MQQSSETELAMAQQPALLGLDWEKRLTKKARATLKGAKSVAFVGTGTSYHCALWAHWLCLTSSEGKLPSRAITTWDFLVGQMQDSLPKTELVVVISHRGNKSLTKRLLDSLGRHRHLLVCGEDAPVGTHSFVHTSPQETSNAHTMSLIGAMGAASEVVAALLSKKAAAKLRIQRKEAAILLQDVSAETIDLGNALGGIMTRGANLHFIGGGPFHAVALELALKAREMIHMAAHAYNTEEFLHGPVASLEEEDTLVVLRPLGTSKSSLEKLLYQKRTDACRASAEAVGALVIEPVWGKPILATAAQLNAAWQAVLPLFWGQVLCLATAVMWEINPDSNRCDDPRYEEARLRAHL